ncbi:hypothetical protein NY2A_b770L [Paramecium bursaria Chlorella virus NY2A]|uniref:Uncharacterized protein b770L n=1 Tax=Paramecium bursaria Chlorella virus NY2A TaxID=46021 RepID=A7IXU5_PBCVN|nr:hypothetical protein NY2A_b770L [Paramecium bursaria Chlorella virus NY2A]YP_001498778.1 hypothetical protein AR158_C697L [Paramecium bursaria Chlorella virus AR158]ABT15169.1 hypothetical protein NY2A_b770L [Paramecium bursaria Chlorella virus NY2A]ABU44242.1 hypothetical protein AR158_C697L [Paramecium bursaria Chlorella virus AR158]
MPEFSKKTIFGMYSFVMRTTSPNKPDSACSKPFRLPAMLKPVQGNPPVIISIGSSKSRFENFVTSSNTGLSGNFVERNS